MHQTDLTLAMTYLPLPPKGWDCGSTTPHTLLVVHVDFGLESLVDTLIISY